MLIFLQLLANPDLSTVQLYNAVIIYHLNEQRHVFFYTLFTMLGSWLWEQFENRRCSLIVVSSVNLLHCGSASHVASYIHLKWIYIYIPVFYTGLYPINCVRPSVRPSIHPSVRPSVHPSGSLPLHRSHRLS